MSSREDAPRDHLVVVFLCRLGVHGERKVAQSCYQSWILLVMTDLASTEGQSCHLLFVEAKMVREPEICRMYAASALSPPFAQRALREA
jgi:hypothetical protein